MANRSRPPIRRTPKAPGGWSGGVIQLTNVAAVTKVLLATFVPTASVPETVRRVRGAFIVSSNQQAATENVVGAVGLAVFDDTAVGVGVASLSDPITDVADDIWFAYKPVFVRFNFRDATGADAIGGIVYEFESKAMRKVPQGKSLGLIVANANATDAMSIAGIVRVYATFAR